MRKLLAKIGYDVKVRNRDFAAVLRKVIQDGDIFLDAGCGDLFSRNHLDHGKVIGVDVQEPRLNNAQSEFVIGSILNLPFGNGAFRFTGSLDVIEHLSSDQRETAIHELVRTSKSGVLIGFPFAGKPENVDKSFYKHLSRKSREIPGWLDEHLRQNYPVIEEIEAILRSSFMDRGDSIQISVSFSESLAITRILRKAAIISGEVFVLINTFFGITLPVHPWFRSANNSYRAIVFAQIQEN